MGLIKGDTRSLVYSSYARARLDTVNEEKKT